MRTRTVPVGNVLVGDTGGNIEHDDTTLSVDIVSISQTTELLLTSCVPNIELDCAQVLIPALVGATKETAEGPKRGQQRGIPW